jgi:hypothetical protein
LNTSGFNSWKLRKNKILFILMSTTISSHLDGNLLARIVTGDGINISPAILPEENQIAPIQVSKPPNPCIESFFDLPTWTVDDIELQTPLETTRSIY